LTSDGKSSLRVFRPYRAALVGTAEIFHSHKLTIEDTANTSSGLEPGLMIDVKRTDTAMRAVIMIERPFGQVTYLKV
jgi:hypothetical protein